MHMQKKNRRACFKRKKITILEWIKYTSSMRTKHGTTLEYDRMLTNQLLDCENVPQRLEAVPFQAVSSFESQSPFLKVGKKRKKNTDCK